MKPVQTFIITFLICLIIGLVAVRCLLLDTCPVQEQAALSAAPVRVHPKTAAPHTIDRTLPPTGIIRDMLPQKDTDDVLSFEHLTMTAPNDEAFNALMAILEQSDLTVLKTIPKLRAISLSATHAALRKLLSDHPELADYAAEIDTVVTLPDSEELYRTTGNAPFNNTLLPWLGLNPDTANRGKGVTIAVLDQAVTYTPATLQTNLTQMDLFAIAADSEGATHGNSVVSILTANQGELQGLAPQADILSIPVLDQNGNGSTFNLAAAIIAAVDNGANIISLSLSTDTPSQLLQAAVDYATEAGTVIVAAAGNDGLGTVCYPASYDNVIAVAACDAHDNATEFSNYGKQIDITAPGVCLTVDDGEGLTTFSGTSAAAPCVSGVIATILSESPELTAAEAAACVLGKAIDNGAPGVDSVFGNGLLNYTSAANWDNPDYTDTAATGQHLDMEHATATSTPLVLSAQNIGNTTVTTLTLDYTVNQTDYTATFSNVAPGASVSTTVNISNGELDSLRVITRVITDSAESSLENNTKATRISVISE